ncbi:alpha/beta fold hydrolase [Polaromonas sp. LjRoot131]|uniref:alpha/beta fold hydrolase n=1 Tax=Polaromonas sp. LjRoot131 TaxID=3342262 RepID=UPI003ECF0C91
MFFVYKGHQIHYSDHGEGYALLFIHGLGGSALNWTYQRQYFTRNNRVICIDLPGHGKSDGKSIPFVEFAKVLNCTEV